LHERALAIRQRTLGPLNTEVAVTLGDIGVLHRERGDLDRAAADFAQALAIQQAMLQADHPDVALTLGNLGSVARGRGDDVGAAALFERALAIEERAFGPAHERVAGTLTVLADVWLALGRREQALTAIERALAIPLQGRTQPDEIADARFVGARVLWAEGREHDRALALAREAADHYAAAGPAHADARAAVESWLRARESPSPPADP
jgi:tetratricopeptide (TPR) repeat protein